MFFVSSMLSGKRLLSVGQKTWMLKAMQSLDDFEQWRSNRTRMLSHPDISCSGIVYIQHRTQDI